MSAHESTPRQLRPARRLAIAITIAALVLVALPSRALEETAPGDRAATTAKADGGRAAAWLQLDLWYTSHSSGDGPARRRLSLAGPQGVPIAFGFAPVRHATMTSRPSPANFVEIEIEVAGSVRGSLRPDGTIDVDLDLRRTVRATIRGGATPGPTTEGGERNLTVRPGEAVEIVLPPIRRPPILGVDQLGDLVDVFTGSREEIVLTITLQESAPKRDH